MNPQEQAQENLSKVAQKRGNHLDIVNGKIIFRTSDIFKVLGVDYIG